MKILIIDMNNTIEFKLNFSKIEYQIEDKLYINYDQLSKYYYLVYLKNKVNNLENIIERSINRLELDKNIDQIKLGKDKSGNIDNNLLESKDYIEGEINIFKNKKKKSINNLNYLDYALMNFDKNILFSNSIIRVKYCSGS